jgi:hypothetical protein
VQQSFSLNSYIGQTIKLKFVPAMLPPRRNQRPCILT